MSARGMYGLRVDGPAGLADMPGALRPVSADAPSVQVTVSQGVPTLASGHLDADSMAHRYPLDAGQVRMTRVPLTADLVVNGPLDLRAVVHPRMSRVGAVAAQWLGRDCVHAGAFVLDGGAWGVLGAKGTGKSSLMAQLHLLGVTVLSDDLLVLEDGQALAGPGSIDLRRPAADAFGVGELLDLLGPEEQTADGPAVRERWRVPLPDAPASVPLRGWITPGWGDTDGSVTPVPAATRVPLLVGSVPLLHPRADPEHFFDLAMRTSLVWTRRKDFHRSERCARRLLEMLSDLP